MHIVLRRYLYRHKFVNNYNLKQLIPLSSQSYSTNKTIFPTYSSRTYSTFHNNCNNNNNMSEGKCIIMNDNKKSDGSIFSDTNNKSDAGIPFHKLCASSNQLLDINGNPAPLVVLIACGSYSPITNLHLRIFEQAKNYLMYENKSNPLDIIGGILSPVHDLYGKKSLIKDFHRVKMCELATQDSDWIGVSRWEIEQSKWSTTAETMTKYQSAINCAHIYDRPVRALLLCGADLLESTLVPNLWAPHNLELIFGTFGVAVIERIGLDLNKLIQTTPLLKRFESNIHIIPQTISNNISSTSVRQLIANNLSVKYLIPDPVANYIQENGLYGWNIELSKQRLQKCIDRPAL